MFAALFEPPYGWKNDETLSEAFAAFEATCDTVDRTFGDVTKACAAADAWQRAKGGPLEGYVPAYLTKALDTLELATRSNSLRKGQP